MKIIDAPQSKPVTFGDLKPGDVFRSIVNYDFCVKTCEYSSFNLIKHYGASGVDKQTPVIPYPNATLYLHGAPKPEIPAEVQAVLDALRSAKRRFPDQFIDKPGVIPSWSTDIAATFNALEAALTPEPK